MFAPPVELLGWTINPSFEADPAVILNAAGVASETEGVHAGQVAVSVYPVPALSMLKPVNVATPVRLKIDVVPERKPVPGFVPIATVMVPLVLAVLPKASCAVTSIPVGEEIAEPAVALAGGIVNASLEAPAAKMLNEALTAEVRTPEVAVNV
jgi:hypothetical protein